jgi:hypothetical protein
MVMPNIKLDDFENELTAGTGHELTLVNDRYQAINMAA